MPTPATTTPDDIFAEICTLTAQAADLAGSISDDMTADEARSMEKRHEKVLKRIEKLRGEYFAAGVALDQSIAINPHLAADFGGDGGDGLDAYGRAVVDSLWREWAAGLPAPPRASLSADRCSTSVASSLKRTVSQRGA